MRDDPPASPPRGRGVLLFLAIVWSIGASFLLLQSFFTHASETLLLRTDPKMGLPRQTAQALAHCTALIAHLPSPPFPPLTAAQSKHLAWQLGAHLGSTFAFIDTGRSTPDRAAKSLAEGQVFAHQLGVPEVAFPPPGRAAYRLYDFTVALEDDPQCVAAALAARYSAQHANLYKFGASVAVAYVYRLSVPQAGPVLSVGIQRYGTAAGVPARFWEPLLANPAAGGDARLRENSILEGIDNYLR